MKMHDYDRIYVKSQMKLQYENIISEIFPKILKKIFSSFQNFEEFFFFSLLLNNIYKNFFIPYSISKFVSSLSISFFISISIIDIYNNILNIFINLIFLNLFFLRIFMINDLLISNYSYLFI